MMRRDSAECGCEAVDLAAGIEVALSLICNSAPKALY
jgi:hypothetical protein